MSFSSRLIGTLSQTRARAQREAALAYFDPAQAHDTDAAHERRQFARTPSVEEIPATSAGSKRRVDREITEAEERRKRLRRTSTSSGLVPDYNYSHPSDAVAIAIESHAPHSTNEQRREYNLEKDWPSSSKPWIQTQSPAQAKPNMPAARRPGPFKPLNTLSKTAPQAASSQNRNQNHVGTSNAFFSNYTAGQGSTAPKPSLNGRNNFPPPSEHIDRCERASKRQKMESKQNEYGDLPSDPIEVEDSTPEDLKEKQRNQFGYPTFPEPTQSRPRAPSSSQRSQQGSRVSLKRERGRQREDPLGGGEMLKVDKTNDSMMSSRQSLRAPKSLEVPKSSKSSSASHLGNEWSGQSSGTRETPVVLGEDDDTIEVTGSTALRRPRRDGLDSIPRQQPRPQSTQQQIQPDQHVPPIQLLRGIEEYAQKHAHRQLEQQQQRSARNGNRDVQIMKDPRFAKQQAPAQSAKKNRTVGDGHLDKYMRRPSANSALRGQFVRDPHSPEEMSHRRPNNQMLKTKLRDRMQGSNRVGFNDDDELSGPRTVHSRNTSPQKAAPLQFRANERPNNSMSRRSRSPSDLKPTKFKSESLKVESEDDDPHEVRIPVNGLFCTGFAGYQKNLELRWDENAVALILYSCGKPVGADGEDGKFVSINQLSVSRDWTECENDPRAILRGSMYSGSSGKFLLDFPNMGDKHNCWSYLDAATKETLKESTKTVDQDRLHKMFENLKAEIIDDKRHSQKSVIPSRSTQPSRIQMRLQDKQRSSVEKITVEDDQPNVPRTKLRSRMQNTLREELQNQGYQQPRCRQDENITRSPYFDQPRRSGRVTGRMQAKSPTPPRVVEKWSEMNNPAPWRNQVVYPSEGPRRVTLEFCDLLKLDDEEYLNDSLVNFWLRRIEENMPAEHKDKVHFFNTYFYTSMTTKKGKTGFNYDAIQRWTKSVDLFTKPYVVVPINASYHWFAVIICNLPNIRRELSDVKDEEASAADQADGPVVIDLPSEQPPSDDIEGDAQALTSSNRASPEDEGDVFTFDANGQASNAQPDEGAGDTEALHETAKGKKPQNKGPGMRKFETDQPVLISMDSFGLARTAELKYLKLYLQKEAEMKRAMDLDLKELQGVTAKSLPEQSNLTDCGVYLLAYIEQFCKDPARFVKKILRREDDIKEDFEGFHPSHKRTEIRNVLLELEKVQYERRIAQKKAKAAAKNAATTPAPSTQAVADSSAKEKSPTPSAPVEPSDNLPAPSEEPRADQPKPQSELTAMGIDEGEDLEVAMPRGVGERIDDRETSIPSSPPPLGHDEDDEDEEMLDNPSDHADSNAAGVDEAVENALSEKDDDMGREQPSPSVQRVGSSAQPLLDHLERAIGMNDRSENDTSPQESEHNDVPVPSDDVSEEEGVGTGSDGEAQEERYSPKVIVPKGEADLAQGIKEPEIPESQEQAEDPTF
ncbi:Ubiquitin-like-specific protease 2 [Lecanosticta acicola]|uniref:Ubiquitin-like-specific protease 2 n=1 Tax=Lecanosticta acicola TaxID=111012 RepID=A0AAI8YZ06_9PEZI|nr:Ubiquitin-like-specific protease 2 [Lecanosticta acicola]